MRVEDGRRSTDDVPLIERPVNEDAYRDQPGTDGNRLTERLPGRCTCSE